MLERRVRANINAMFGDNNTYLHYTMLYYNGGIQTVQIVNMLCEAGANVNAINARYETPLELAAKNRIVSDDVIIALLLKGATPTAHSFMSNALDDLVDNHPTLPASLERVLSNVRQLEIRVNMERILSHVRISNIAFSPSFASPIVIAGASPSPFVDDRRTSFVSMLGKREGRGETPDAKKRLTLE